MPQCSAVDLAYHLFGVLCRLYVAVFVLFYVLLCANKRVHSNLHDLHKYRTEPVAQNLQGGSKK